MKKIITLLVLLTVSLNAEKQKLCPIYVEDDIDTEEFVNYKGVKVYMCCGTCVRAWEKNPDYYAKVSQVMKTVPSLMDIDLSKVKLLKQRFCIARPDRVVHPDSPNVTYKGKKIYFFKSSDIRRKWDPNPEEAFKKARESGLLPQFD